MSTSSSGQMGRKDLELETATKKIWQFGWVRLMAGETGKIRWRGDITGKAMNICVLSGDGERRGVKVDARTLK